MRSEETEAPEFETERLVLRMFRPDDGELLVAMDTDPEVMRYINDGKGHSREEILANSVVRILAAADPDRGTGFRTVIERATGEAVGWIHLRQGFYWKGDLELGYRFVRRVWGRGYATEGCRALLGFAFGTLGAPRVIATTMRPNEASRRVMEKLGMQFECEFEETRWPGPDKRAVKYVVHNPTREKPRTNANRTIKER